MVGVQARFFCGKKGLPLKKFTEIFTEMAAQVCHVLASKYSGLGMSHDDTILM